jgi:hypothetical protein
MQVITNKIRLRGLKIEGRKGPLSEVLVVDDCGESADYSIESHNVNSD